MIEHLKELRKVARRMQESYLRKHNFYDFIMQKMLGDLHKGFTLTVERNGATNNANILFKSLDGTAIINQANITFADTGGANPQGKTNAFVNIGKYAK